MTNNWWGNRSCQFCLNHVFTFSLDRSCNISPILLNGYQLFAVNELNTANTNLPSLLCRALSLDNFLMKEGKKKNKTKTTKNSAKKLKPHMSREASRRRSRLDKMLLDGTRPICVSVDIYYKHTPIAHIYGKQILLGTRFRVSESRSCETSVRHQQQNKLKHHKRVKN